MGTAITTSDVLLLVSGAEVIGHKRKTQGLVAHIV